MANTTRETLSFDKPLKRTQRRNIIDGNLTPRAEARRQSQVNRPYDRQSKTWKRPRPAAGGGVRYERAPIAETYAEALIRRVDYWHPGGPLIDNYGAVVGEHGPGWFLDGYKWKDDPDHVQSVMFGEEVPSYTDDEPFEEITTEEDPSDEQE